MFFSCVVCERWEIVKLCIEFVVTGHPVGITCGRLRLLKGRLSHAFTARLVQSKIHKYKYKYKNKYKYKYKYKYKLLMLPLQGSGRTGLLPKVRPQVQEVLLDGKHERT